MKKTKEKIIDFGELGKWSKSTLLAQSNTKIGWFGKTVRFVKIIDDNYENYTERLEKIINKDGKKIIMFSTISKLIDKLDEYNEAVKKRDQLYDDYQKYEEVMRKL